MAKPKMGRPPKPEYLLAKKRKELHFTDEQWDIIERAAVRAGVTTAVFCRDAVLDKAVKH